MGILVIGVRNSITVRISITFVLIIDTIIVRVFIEVVGNPIAISIFVRNTISIRVYVNFCRCRNSIIVIVFVKRIDCTVSVAVGRIVGITKLFAIF